MRIRRVEADYLVVEAGASGMAFTDALIDHADATGARRTPSCGCTNPRPSTVLALDRHRGTIDWPGLMTALRATPCRTFILEHDNPSDHARFARGSLAAARAF